VLVPAPDPALAPVILASLARERLRQFRRAVPSGNNRAVLDLYVLDSELASRFHAVFRVVEVTLRETMHRALAAVFGPRWFSEPAFRSALDLRTLTAVDDAARAGCPRGVIPPAGAVVAQLMFGTWVQVLAPGARRCQETAIWQPALAPAFQHAVVPGQARGRAEVFELAQRVNWARNRVNHCESVVFGFPLPGQITANRQRRRATPHQVLDDARALVTAMNDQVAAWLDAWDELDALLADAQVARALAFKDRDPGISLEGRR